MKTTLKKIVTGTLIAVSAMSVFAAPKFNSKKSISVLSREDGSGTRGAFIELFGIEKKDASGKKIDYTTDEASITNSTAVMLTSVAGDRYAIGYVSLGSLNNSVKAVKIDGAEATVTNINNGSYKISRPFNIAVKDELSSAAQDFVNFIVSDEGQKVITANKYIKIQNTKAYSSNKAGGKIVVAGSSSVSPVMEKLIESYKNVNPNATIELQTSDSTTGVTNAINLAHTQPGSNMNLYLSNTLDGKEFNTFSYYKKYVGIHGEKANFGTIAPANSITGGETFISNQRRIASRIMAAANLVTQSSRHGRPNWIVTNTQVLSALQDNANFVVAPVTNTLTQDGSQSIYFAGSIAGMNVYVDPYMAWDDTRILVGKKANVTAAGVSDPGVVFMPYILADTVQTIVEGTMAPKLLVNSRFAIVDAGFYPEQNYYCFGVETNGMGII